MECCSDAVLDCEEPLILNFVIRPTNQSFLETQMVVFECQVNDPTSAIIWSFTSPYNNTFNNIPLILSDQDEGITISGVNGGSSLTVTAAQFPNHVGMYTCSASREDQAISSSAWLEIKGWKTHYVIVSLSHYISYIKIVAIDLFTLIKARSIYIFIFPIEWKYLISPD